MTRRLQQCRQHGGLHHTGAAAVGLARDVERGHGLTGAVGDRRGERDQAFLQFLVNQAKGEISLCLYIRSNDVGLGTPFNLTEGAALLTLMGRLTGYKPRWFTYFIGDAHIYENHVDMLQEQLKREPFPAPERVLPDRSPDDAVTGQYEPEGLEKVEPSDFWLEGYQHHAPLTAPMAV
mgnify:CR=1 FL=1